MFQESCNLFPPIFDLLKRETYILKKSIPRVESWYADMSLLQEIRQASQGGFE